MAEMVLSYPEIRQCMAPSWLHFQIEFSLIRYHILIYHVVIDVS